MAKAIKDVEVVEDAPKEETPKGTRPTDLAKELGVNPKSLRAYLRRAFPRTGDSQGTSWYLNADQVKAATDHFTAVEDDDEVEDEG